MRVSRYSLLAFLFLISTASKLFAQQNTIDNEKVSGDVYFDLGPSGVPVYPRGGGRNEHWRTGINLKLDYKKMEFYFTPGVVGAATFDNPDRFQFMVGGAYKLPRMFYLQIMLTDAYALNNISPVDPAARRPASGVNSLWLGGFWKLKKDQNDVSVFARYAPRGNEPVFFTHFTKPYASWNFGAESRSKIIDKTFFIFNPEIYMSNKINMARAVLDVGVERQVHGRFIFGGYYTIYRNINEQRGMTDFLHRPLRKSADRLFFGIRVPFGNNQ